MKRLRVLGLCIMAVFALSLSAVRQETVVLVDAEADSNTPVEQRHSSGFLPRMALELSSVGAKTEEEYAEQIVTWREVNEDVVGYLDIPDFEISYPVLQGEDNKTYLRTNIYKEKDNAGCIFLDANYPDIYSPVKLIHGHHMANKTMFGKLPDMLKWETLDGAPHIYYTDDLGTKEFQIFSVFSVNSEEESVIVSQYLLMEQLETYKQDYIERSWVPVSEIPDSTELLMLNTCWYGESGREHFLHCIVVAARID